MSIILLELGITVTQKDDNSFHYWMDLSEIQGRFEDSFKFYILIIGIWKSNDNYMVAQTGDDAAKSQHILRVHHPSNTISMCTFTQTNVEIRLPYSNQNRFFSVISIASRSSKRISKLSH